MEFDYTLVSSKSFNDAVQAVEKEISNYGMKVLYVHDVQKSLSEKGFKRDGFKIVEFCNAKFANAFLNADIKIGLCMPCKINVYISGGETFISGMRPVVLSQFFPNADLGGMPAELDQIIKTIINNSK